MTILSYKELMEPAFLLCILLSFFLLLTTAIATTNLTDLVISGVTINVSDISEVLGPMKSLHSLTITHTNLSGFLPKHWPSNLSNIDMSDNNLTGELPTSVGNMLLLQNLSLASNNLSGPIPDSISALSELVHLDLSSNQLNGTVPKFISELKNLKYLNLENNKLHGVMSFNESFIKKMSVFKISGNNDLCYDQTTVSSKLKLGIPPCDKHELTIRKLLVKDSINDQSNNTSKNCDNNDDDKKKQEEWYNKIVHDHKGPKRVVLGVAIGLSCTIFFIILLVILSKWRG